MEEDLDPQEDSREDDEDDEENEDPFVDNLIYQIEDLRNKVNTNRQIYAATLFMP